jgi:excisionase family DNA binding protein
VPHEFAVLIPDQLLEEIVERVLERLPEREPQDEYLSTEEAASYLGVARGTLHNLRSEVIPFSQPGGKGGRRHYRRSDLDAYMQGRKNGASQTR